MSLPLTLQNAIRIEGEHVVVTAMNGYYSYSIPIKPDIYIPTKEEGLFNVWIEWDISKGVLEPPIAVEFTEQALKPVSDSLYNKLQYRENLLLQQKEEELAGVY